MPVESSVSKIIENEESKIVSHGVWRVSEAPNAYIRISQVRVLQEKLLLRPYSAKRRFVIVVDSERMKIEAANAFLKTLEEPPEDTTIIMITSHISTLLPTILSRGQNIKFRNLSSDEISELLQHKYSISEIQADKVAVFGDGSLQKALEFAIDEDLINLRNSFFRAFLSSSRNDIYNYWPSRTFERLRAQKIIEFIIGIISDGLFIKNGLEKRVVNLDFKDEITEFFKREKPGYFYSKIKVCNDAYKALKLNIDLLLIRDYLFGEFL